MPVYFYENTGSSKVSSVPHNQLDDPTTNLRVAGAESWLWLPRISWSWAPHWSCSGICWKGQQSALHTLPDFTLKMNPKRRKLDVSCPFRDETTETNRINVQCHGHTPPKGCRCANTVLRGLSSSSWRLPCYDNRINVKWQRGKKNIRRTPSPGLHSWPSSPLALQKKQFHKTHWDSLRSLNEWYNNPDSVKPVPRALHISSNPHNPPARQTLLLAPF